MSDEFGREVVAEFTRRGLVGDEYDRARKIGTAIADLTHSVLERAWKRDPGFASFRRVTLAAMWYASALIDGSMCESPSGHAVKGGAS